MNFDIKSFLEDTLFLVDMGCCPASPKRFRLFTISSFFLITGILCSCETGDVYEKNPVELLPPKRSFRPPLLTTFCPV